MLHTQIREYYKICEIKEPTSHPIFDVKVSDISAFVDIHKKKIRQTMCIGGNDDLTNIDLTTIDSATADLAERIYASWK